ncbi:purine-binding chemotaxis protein CheW [bacterium]|nr:purine-binding chemotaxis protein CheW [bacterium]
MQPSQQNPVQEGQADWAGSALLGGKNLTFRLAAEEYGIEILKVVEIIKLMEITVIPRMPEYVRGVINLRGIVIPVVDLRRKFAMPCVEDTAETCIIVVMVRHESGDVQTGILVDTVSEVLDIPDSEIEEAPQFGSNVRTDFIRGMARAKGGVKILLNIDCIVRGEEMAAVSAA